MNIKSVLEHIYKFFLLHPWLFFVIWALWLSLEYLGPGSYVKTSDFANNILSEWMGAVQETSKYGLNYIFASALCGTERLLAVGPVFRIDTLPFFVLPGWLTLGLMAFVQRFMAGYFTYRLCKDHLRFGEVPSIIAGLAYSICFFYHGEGFSGAGGFPFILWSLEYIYHKKGTITYVLGALLGVFVLFSSSFGLSIPFILVLSVAWFVLVRRIYTLRFISIFATFCVVLLAGEIPVIYAGLVNSDLSHRSVWLTGVYQYQWNLYRVLTSWSRSFGMITRHVMEGTLLLCLLGTLYGIRRQGSLGIKLSGIRQYLGLVISKLRTYIIPVARIIGILLAIMWLIALLQGREFMTVFMIEEYWGIWFLVGIAIIGVCICKPINRILLMVLLLLLFCLLDMEVRYIMMSFLDSDLLAGINWRFYLLAPFFAIISGTYGLNLALQSKLSLINKTNKWKEISSKAIMCIVAVCVLFSLSISLKIDHYRARDQGENYATLFENEQLQSLASGEIVEYFRVATIPFYSKSYQLYPSQVNAYGLESVDGYVVWYSLRYKQYWTEVIKPVLSIYGDDPNCYKYYKKFHSWGHQAYLFPPPLKLDEIPFTNYYNLNLLALANTKYIISHVPLSDTNLTLLPSHNDFENSDIYIYENEICLPRSFVCGNVTIYDSEDDLLEAMSADDIETLRESAYITKEFAEDIDAELLNVTQSEVKIEAYSPDRITLYTKTDGSGILVITNNYSPYWSCSVNGIERNIIPVYHTFMGVMIEEGNNRIEIEYDPPYWTFW